MTRKEFTAKHEAEIAKISNTLKDQGFDLGMAESVFMNAARHGKIPDGDDPCVRAALATVGGSAYWEAVHEEWETVKDE